MKSAHFYLWILILLVGYMQVFHVMREHFSGKAGLHQKIARLEKQVEREKLRVAVADFQMRDFRETVATLMPGHDKLAGPQRNLASVVQSPDTEKLQLERAASMFEKGRKLFADRHFQASNDLFRTLIRTHPSSVHLTDSYFLLAEGLYQTQELDECLDIIETMINLFPENHLTGFAMLRMGQVFADRDRIEDAEQVYRTILGGFRHEGLSSQANTLLKEISL